MNNSDKLDLNQLLSVIAKMDKNELEKNLSKAQEMLKNSNISPDNSKKK